MPQLHKHLTLPAILNRDKVLPINLTDILEKYDPEDFDIVITNVDYKTSEPKLDFQISVQGYNEEDNFVRSWTIETKHHRQSKIFLDSASSLEISKDHPILWKFSDMQSEIYFNGHCSDVDKLFISLYKIHRALFEDLIPFSDSIRSVDDLSWLMKTTSGLLAQGPRKLMTEYSGLLAQFNLQYSVIGDRIPTYWDGEKHVNEVGNAKVLFIDNSYIIADDFNFL